MDYRRRMHHITLLLSLFLFSGIDALAQSTNEPLVVFLVRHAEKERTGSDPALTNKGQARAQKLARFLRDSGIKTVHSTDYRRTRETARPFANQISASIQQYNPREQSALIGKIKSAGGRHLVVGHSNTIPALVRAFGGIPGGPIDEPTEYDRLYILSFDENGNASTVLLRYGS